MYQNPKFVVFLLIWIKQLILPHCFQMLHGKFCRVIEQNTSNKNVFSRNNDPVIETGMSKFKTKWNSIDLSCWCHLKLHCNVLLHIFKISRYLIYINRPGYFNYDQIVKAHMIYISHISHRMRRVLSGGGRSYIALSTHCGLNKTKIIQHTTYKCIYLHGCMEKFIFPLKHHPSSFLRVKLIKIWHFFML